jgi:hypothetical protein
MWRCLSIAFRRRCAWESLLHSERKLPGEFAIAYDPQAYEWFETKRDLIVLFYMPDNNKQSAYSTANTCMHLPVVSKASSWPAPTYRFEMGVRLKKSSMSGKGGRSNAYRSTNHVR